MQAHAWTTWLGRPRSLGWVFAIGGGSYPLWRGLAPAGTLDPAWLWWAIGALFVAVGIPSAWRGDGKTSRLLYLPSLAVALHQHALFVANPGEIFYALAAAMNLVTTLLVLPGTLTLVAYSAIVVGAAVAGLALGTASGSLLYWICVAWVLALEHRWLSRERAAAALRAADQTRLEARLAEERSRRLQLQEELSLAQHMESIGRLAGGLAHEFNNQLMAIRILAELMEQEAPAALAPDLDQVKRAIDQAAGLTTQLLRSLRPRPGRGGPVDLNAVLQEQVTILRHLMGESTLVVCPPYEACWVPVSRERAEQVLLNLALNARDAMPDGGTLTVTLRRLKRVEVELPPHLGESEAESFVRLAVSDTGVGIDPDDRPRIFDPFFTTKADRGRSGLGLSTVYGIVADSGGHVRVASEPGQGARFEIYWPGVREQAGAAAKVVSAAPAETRRARVLLVEDQPELRRGMVRWLEGSGHSVIEAGTAEQALALLEIARHQVDLVATDVVLPGLDGIELIRRLRATRPGLRALAFSGHLDHLSRTGRQLPEGVPLLDKPFDPRRLRQLIAELLADEDVPHPSA